MGLGTLIDIDNAIAVYTDCSVSGSCHQCDKPLCPGCSAHVVYLLEEKFLCAQCAAAMELKIPPELRSMYIETYLDEEELDPETLSPDSPERERLHKKHDAVMANSRGGTGTEEETVNRVIEGKLAELRCLARWPVNCPPE